MSGLITDTSGRYLEGIGIRMTTDYFYSFGAICLKLKSVKAVLFAPALADRSIIAEKIF